MSAEFIQEYAAPAELLHFFLNIQYAKCTGTAVTGDDTAGSCDQDFVKDI